MPFLVRWPARVKPGVSGALVSQVDLLACLAQLTGRRLPAEDAPDSVPVLPALLGESPAGRDHLVEHAAVLALRQGPWKLIEPGKGPRVLPHTGVETGRAAEAQLYNLAEDPGETRDVAARHPAKVQELRDLLGTLRDEKRPARRGG